jgi:hypothetical protein
MNRRGEYGTRGCQRGEYSQSWNAHAVHVGIVTARVLENEQNQLNDEITSFDKQLTELVRKTRDQAGAKGSELRRVNEELDALEPTMARIRDLADAIVRIRASMEQGNPQAHLIRLRDAQLALEQFMPVAKRREVIDRYTKLAKRRDELLAKELGETPLLKFNAAWRLFKKNWDFFSHRGAAGWEVQGTWDHTQDYRRQFVDLYRKAPFTPTGPAPADPSGREAPGILDSLGLAGASSVFKWVLIGGLGIAGAVMLSSIVANVRKGRDPIEHYTQLYRGRSAT